MEIAANARIVGMAMGSEKIDGFLDDQRMAVNIIIAMYGIYLAILWATLASKSLFVSASISQELVTRNEQLGIMSPSFCRKLYFWTVWLFVSCFAYSFGVFATLTVPSAESRSLYEADNRKTVFLCISIWLVLWLFGFPVTFLDNSVIPICVSTFFFSLFMFTLLASGLWKRPLMPKKGT